MINRKGFEIAGWAIFVASAAMFTASSIRAGDAFSTTGSILFLAACFVFLVPLACDRS